MSNGWDSNGLFQGSMRQPVAGQFLSDAGNIVYRFSILLLSFMRSGGTLLEDLKLDMSFAFNEQSVAFVRPIEKVRILNDTWVTWDYSQPMV
jgi:hypothetical protein